MKAARGLVAVDGRENRIAKAFTRCCTRSTAITGSPPEFFPPTSTTPGSTLRKGRNCARWWRPCFRWRRTSPFSVIPLLGDRLEKIAYNALPGTLTDDMWGHQYDQQANQVHGQCGEPPLGHERSRFEHFRSANRILVAAPPTCIKGGPSLPLICGWRLRMAVWRRSLMAPAKCSTQVAAGVPVSIAETTDYPFRETVNLDGEDSSAREVSSRAADSRLGLRAPPWP